MIEPPPIVLCVGEPLIALAPPLGRDLTHTDHVEIRSGGAELNVAIHLARLGVRSRFAGGVGDDPFGARIAAELVARGVETALRIDPSRPTGLYVKEPTSTGIRPHYYRAGSATSSWDPAIVTSDLLRGVTHLHVSAILPALGSGCVALTDELFSRIPQVSFDVNFRPALWPRDEAAPVILGLARRARLVFAGLDEAAALWDVTDADDVRRLVPEGELVVKDNANPVTVFRGGDRWEIGVPPVDVVDPVGAGDAFAAGYLAVRWTGGEPVEATRAGNDLAAAVLAAPGDHEGRIDPDPLGRAAADVATS